MLRCFPNSRGRQIQTKEIDLQENQWGSLCSLQSSQIQSGHSRRRWEKRCGSPPADSCGQAAGLCQWPVLYQPLDRVQHTGALQGERKRPLTQFLITCGLTGTTPCSSRGQFRAERNVFQNRKAEPAKLASFIFSHPFCCSTRLTHCWGR